VNKVKYIDIFRRLRDASEENARNDGEPTVGFSFTTMLQQTNQFRSRVS
jgi:hypothetical protein